MERWIYGRAPPKRGINGAERTRIPKDVFAFCRSKVKVEADWRPSAKTWDCLNWTILWRKNQTISVEIK